MSVKYSKELKKMAQKYMEGDRVIVDRLRQVLESKSADVRYALIEDERDGKGKGFHVLHESVHRNDTRMIKCLLDRFHSEQMWQVLSIGTYYGSTPLHIAAYAGYTDTARCLLEFTPKEYRFHYLKLKDGSGDTALHRAAAQNHLQTVQVLLSSLPPQQQLQPLKVANNHNESVADILSSQYPQGTFIGTAVMLTGDGKVTTMTTLESELVEQRAIYERELRTLKEKQAEMDRKQAEMDRKQAEMERRLEQLDVYLRQTLCTNNMEDQEFPE